MPLRGGKEYLKKEYLKKVFPNETQPFNMILLHERKKEYDVNIDFDYSSKAWRKNKIQLGEGMFKYKRYRKILI